MDASSNRLLDVPEDLAECAKLRRLVLNGNENLASLPQDLGLFQPDLRGVWARGCGLTALPSGLEAASGLTDLDIGSNRLRRGARPCTPHLPAFHWFRFIVPPPVNQRTKKKKRMYMYLC